MWDIELPEVGQEYLASWTGTIKDIPDLYEWINMYWFYTQLSWYFQLCTNLEELMKQI